MKGKPPMLTVLLDRLTELMEETRKNLQKDGKAYALGVNLIRIDSVLEGIDGSDVVEDRQPEVRGRLLDLAHACELPVLEERLYRVIQRVGCP